MVKVSFIVEGAVEKIIVEKCFIGTGWLKEKNIEVVGPVIDAKGGGNLCPQNMGVFVDMAQSHNPEKIIILTDLECDPCITKTKERLGDCDTCIMIIARKAIEGWFLADDALISGMTRGRCRTFPEPEKTEDMPYDVINELLVEHVDRGGGDKVRLANKVAKNGFNVESSAVHPNCQSAKYFVDKITSLGQV